MPRFRKTATPERQALSVAKTLHREQAVDSVRTLNNYKDSLERVASNMQTYGMKGEIRDLTPEAAKQYLEIRSASVGQKTLDMERQAVQCMMRTTGVIEKTASLPVIKSEITQVLTSRAYTPEQVSMVAHCQREANRLSTQLAHSAGLRAHELYTLRPIREQRPDQRPALDSKFQGREGEYYTVTGKGGLTREVVIPKDLASQLEARRLDAPERVTDRGVHYTRCYDIPGGKKWADSFSKAASRALGWSEGAHGTRHSYAQERMKELQHSGLSRDHALETVSQEMGHFRPEITECYLR